MDRVEHIVRLVLAVYIVGMLSWIAIADPVMSTHSQMIVKAFMAFAFAALMASMLGFIKVEGRWANFSLRAAGGCAVWVIVWFTLPKVVDNLDRQGEARLHLKPISMVDIRSVESPSNQQLQSAAGVAITVPMNASATSRFDSSYPAKIFRADMLFFVGEHELTLPWLYFVKHVQGQKADSIFSTDPLQNAQTIEVEAGKHEYREIMFATSSGQLSWRQLLNYISNSSGFKVLVKWNITGEEKEQDLLQECNVSAKSERVKLVSLLNEGKIPKRMTFICNT